MSSLQKALCNHEQQKRLQFPEKIMEIRFTDMTIIKNSSNVGIQNWQDFQRKNINWMEFKNRIRLVSLDSLP